jgi:hypothetical protein
MKIIQLNEQDRLEVDSANTGNGINSSTSNN